MSASTLTTGRAAPLARIIAHRGASAQAPENTLAALRLAADQGASAVEIDVAISADGIAYLHHDDRLERCTNGRGRLCDLDSTAADRLYAGGGQAAFAREPLPRLSAAIALLQERGLALNLEIKPAAGLEVRTAEAVSEVIAWHWPAGQTLVFSSFSRPALATTHTRLPHIPRALISDRIPDDLETLVTQLQLSNLHCAAHSLDAQGLARLRTLGLGVYCYTVNDPELGTRLLDQLGVDGIFTDQPLAMLQACG